MIRRRTLLALPALAALGGCGFRPLYGDSRAAPVPTHLAGVDVGLIPERHGQLLRLALQERLDPRGANPPARYDLEVQFGIAGEGIGIRRDAAATRDRLVATASWVLRRRDATREEVARGVSRAVDAYNVIDSQGFATDQFNEAARVRLAEALADQIVQRLAVALGRPTA